MEISAASSGDLDYYGYRTKTGTLALRREHCLLLPFGLRIRYSALLAITASRSDRDRRNRILTQLPPCCESIRRSHHNSQCSHLLPLMAQIPPLSFSTEATSSESRPLPVADQR